jgi:hypothetical protein
MPTQFAARMQAEGSIVTVTFGTAHLYLATRVSWSFAINSASSSQLRTHHPKLGRLGLKSEINLANLKVLLFTA